MGVAGTSPAATALLLLRNLITSLFIFADKYLINLAKKYKLLHFVHGLLISSFLFFLRLLPSLFPLLHRPSPENNNGCRRKTGTGTGTGDLGIARALTQLLSIINHVPVNSRKYDVLRSLAEKLIEGNHREGSEELREVNRTVLAAAFDQTISEIEGVVVDGDGGYESPLALTAVRWLSKFGRTEEDLNKSGSSAEKLAAELLWLAEKMSSCGCSDAVCRRWASAAHLGKLAVAAEPRLQSSLIKVAAFLFKQAKDLDMGMDENEKQQQKQMKLKMLITWLPLLCRGSIGTDAPVLRISERSELEMVLEETIGTLQQDEQEQVLALWLHHFTYSSSSDWPNLHASYARWYNASRKLLIHQHH